VRRRAAVILVVAVLVGILLLVWPSRNGREAPPSAIVTPPGAARAPVTAPATQPERMPIPTWLPAPPPDFGPTGTEAASPETSASQLGPPAAKHPRAPAWPTSRPAADLPKAVTATAAAAVGPSLSLEQLQQRRQVLAGRVQTLRAQVQQQQSNHDQIRNEMVNYAQFVSEAAQSARPGQPPPGVAEARLRQLKQDLDDALVKLQQSQEQLAGRQEELADLDVQISQLRLATSPASSASAPATAPASGPASP